MNFQMLKTRLEEKRFLFEELVRRDFKRKYKRTYLGVIWSMLSPLMMLLVMSIVFTKIFGRNTPHYTIYLFSGNLVYQFFSESTRGGMHALVSNASILAKVNVPKHLFVISKSIQTLINFCLTLLIYFVFVACDGIAFHWYFFLLIYPICCLFVFNTGVSLILSAIYVFFRDMEYLYSIMLQVVMYFSAIFYRIETFGESMGRLFYLNPIYCYIRYFRAVVIDGIIPGVILNFLCLFYAVVAVLIGYYIYKKYNSTFILYF